MIDRIDNSPASLSAPCKGPSYINLKLVFSLSPNSHIPPYILPFPTQNPCKMSFLKSCDLIFPKLFLNPAQGNPDYSLFGPRRFPPGWQKLINLT